MTADEGRKLLRDYAKAAADIEVGLVGMADADKITIAVGGLRKLTKIVRTFASALDARLESRGVASLAPDRREDATDVRN